MQFQFSVCMYGTCGRIDNKADFDFDFLKGSSDAHFPQVDRFFRVLMKSL